MSTWVANPLQLSINAFLAQHPDADVISFNWLHCHGSSLFGNPLDLSNTQLRLTDQFKTSSATESPSQTSVRMHQPCWERYGTSSAAGKKCAAATRAAPIATN